MQSITLQTSDSAITSSDILGRINFAASSESDGGAATLQVGSIYAIAEGTFSASANPTSIVIATSASDSNPAQNRIKITNEGHIHPMTNNSYDLGSSTLRYRAAYTNALTINNAYSFPTSDGSADQVLKTDGAGNLSFTTISTGSTYTAGSGLTLAGTQFNVYGGSANFKYAELTSSNSVPTFKYLGSGVTDTPINMEVRSSFQSATGSGTALLFQGTQGQLFSITDNLSSGTIFNVSDITGLPMLEITASGDVEIGEFADNITIHQPVLISGGVPSSTTNKLYNNAGTLYFNGSALGGGISNVVEDTTPQLGGTLDANGNTIDMGTYTITDTKVGQWDTAYGWGDHSSAGYLTSLGTAILDGDFTSQGIMLRGASAGSYSILTDNSSNWNTAYGWGDHSSQGYVTSLTDLSVTSTAAELNLLDGVTATTTEINYIDGVTSNIQTQLDAKAAIASPTFTGTPAAPTAAAGTNTTQIATTAYVTTAIDNLVGGAPGALDTLNELAAAINDDASYASTITTALATKLENIVEDTTPQLGGTLDANGNSIDMGTNTITDTKVGQWDTAYGWGNHASAGYLTSHPTISAASSSDNSGRTYIQDITLDSNGHVTGLTTATETVTDTDTTYTAGSGLTLVGTEFNTAGTGNFNNIVFNNTDGVSENIRIGKNAGKIADWRNIGNDSSAYSYDPNIFIGENAASGLGNGSNYCLANIFIGIDVAKNVSESNESVAIGKFSLRSSDYSNGTVAVGNGTLSDTARSFENTAIGYYAMHKFPSTSSSQDNRSNVAIGRASFSDLANTGVPSKFATAIGAYSANRMNHANYSVMIGAYAGNRASGVNNIHIGHYAGYYCSGVNNIDIISSNTSATTSVIGNNDNKLHIQNTIIGDTSSKLLAIGNVTSSDLTPDATLEIKPNATTDVGLIVQAVASHSASLQEWQNSSETKLLAVGPDGGLEIPSNVPSTTTNKFYNNGGTLYFNGSAVNTDTDTTYTAGTGLSLSSTTFNLDFSSSAIVTEAEGISSNDNDITLPTSAAVKDYVDNNAGGGISNVVEDTTPQLGGDLDAQSNSITSLDQLTFTNKNVKIGSNSHAFASGVSLGYNAGLGTFAKTEPTGGYPISIGVNAGQYNGGYYYYSTVFGTTEFSQHGLISIGAYAGANTALGHSVCIGQEAGRGINYYADILGNITSGVKEVTAVGYKALSQNTTSTPTGVPSFAYSSARNDGSTAIGTYASFQATGQNMVAVGYQAGYKKNGLYNAAFGFKALYTNTPASETGVQNLAVGTSAGEQSKGSYNTFIGNSSAGYRASGDYNIGLGRSALMNATGNYNFEINHATVGASILNGYSDKLHILNTMVGDTSSKLLAIGNVGSADLTPDATLEIKPNATTDVGLIVQAAASHSVSLQEWQNSSETKLLAVGPDGGLEIPSNTPSTTTNKLYNDGSNLRFGTDVIIDSTNVNTGLQWQPLGGGLNVTGLTTTEFSAATLVTEADSISSNDNDTTIPTSAAVKDYVDNNAGGTPAGSDTQIQFNDGGSFGGDADLVWNKTTNALTITGSLNATTKSFLIDHPSKPGMKLQYASLEGPENGVYVRGTTDKGFITLPDYWRDLVHNSSITVTLTPVGQFQPLFVEQKNNREITVGGVCGYYDYVVYGERKDVDKLEVEW